MNRFDYIPMTVASRLIGVDIPWATDDLQALECSRP